MVDAVRAFMTELILAETAADREDAIGWIVVSVDEETSGRCHFGLYPGPEEALAGAGRQEHALRRLLEKGEPGWRHEVYPLYRRAEDG